MRLSPDEQAMLGGEQGAARQRAMELLVEYGDALGAETFVDTNNVHLLTSFHFCPEILDANLDIYDMDAFISSSVLLSDTRIVVDRVKAFTTSHNTTIDLDHWDMQEATTGHDPANFRDLVVGVEAYLRRIGVAVTSTCCPYMAGNIPVLGEHCAWTESSAIAFANSVLGGRTNIEGDHSSFASALTGKTVDWGFHRDENRLASFIVHVEAQPQTVMDWDLLGYYSGFAVGNQLPVFVNIRTRPNMFKLMNLASSVAVTGAVNMFHVVGITPEAHTLEQATGRCKPQGRMTYGLKERKQAYERANTATGEDVEIVAIGCPHFNLERLGVVARLLEGKKVADNVRLMIFTSSQMKFAAERSGWMDIYRSAGAHVITDSCPMHVRTDPSHIIALDSAKIVNQCAGQKGWSNVWYGSTEDCIDAAVTGRWRGELR
jgi:predicted aconitase